VPTCTDSSVLNVAVLTMGSGWLLGALLRILVLNLGRVQAQAEKIPAQADLDATHEELSEAQSNISSLKQNMRDARMELERALHEREEGVRRAEASDDKVHLAEARIRQLKESVKDLSQKNADLVQVRPSTIQLRWRAAKMASAAVHRGAPLHHSLCSASWDCSSSGTFVLFIIPGGQFVRLMPGTRSLCRASFATAH
jgi:exonuclease VII small subunit